jgi:transcriptional regulator with XRE-family HTH domain
MSQQELSKLLGVDRNNLVRFEAGTERVNANLLFRIAKLLGVSPDYFFRGYIEEKAKTSWIFFVVNEHRVSLGVDTQDLQEPLFLQPLPHYVNLSYCAGAGDYRPITATKTLLPYAKLLKEKSRSGIQPLSGFQQELTAHTLFALLISRHIRCVDA